MAEQILSNPAALNALKRHQLVSLSKRYGLKASGKNGDMVDRLQSYAANLPPGEDLQMSATAIPTTPHHSNADFVPAEPDSPTPMSPAAWLQDDRIASMFSLPPTSKLDKKASMMSVSSENWDKMSESGASFVSPMKSTEQGSVRSWKSAGNGQPLSDFGPSEGSERFQSSSSRKSVMAFASSLKRSGTRTFLGPRSSSHPSNLTLASAEEQKVPEPEDDIESIPVPPSPASTVGIPRRHSRLSLFERPSTLRLCSPTPGPHTPRKKGSDLPFFSSASKLRELRNRKSMDPHQSQPETDQIGLTRKSMPALNNYTSASLGSIYPPLPGFQADSDAPPVPPMPGHFPTYQPLKHQPSETFVFGSPDHAVSAAKFSNFSEALLQEMNDKLPEDARMGGEVLKGKHADIRRMVSVTSGLGGEGGWGLMERFEGKEDRFAAAHEREFAKMSSISYSASSSKLPGAMPATIPHVQSATPGQKRKLSAGSAASDIPSAPNGRSMNGEGRQAKRSRMSPGPNVLGSLRDAGRSVMTLLGDGEGKSPEKRRIGEKRQRSRLSIKGNGLRSRLSMFRTNFRRPVAGPRPVEMTAEERSARLQKSLHRRSADLTALNPQTSDLFINSPMSLSSNHPHSRKARMPSTSAQTMMSTASSKIPQRKPLPDFGGRVTSASSSRVPSSMASINALGLPTSTSSSLSSSRKRSQADLIRNARRAPAPPIVKAHDVVLLPASLDPALPRVSSTLYASTASSRARMQATIKPTSKPTSRPLPMAPPSLPSASIAPPSSFRSHGIIISNDRFGAGASRENLFEENFQHPPPPTPSSPSVNSPVLLPSRAANGGTPGRLGSSAATSSPLKPASAASRIRHKNSALSAVKSRGNLREEVDVQRRRAEMRAKSDRRNEEKELRQMLGGLRGGGANDP